MNPKKPPGQTRTIIQIIAFLLVALTAFARQMQAGADTILGWFNVSLHAICPFGGVVSLYELAVNGELVRKVQDASIVLMLVVFAAAVLFGPIFCGYFCPLGSIQEWFGKIGKRIFPKRYNHFVPRKLDRVLRGLRVVVLALVIYQTAMAAKLVFQDYDPYFALFNFFTGEAALAAYGILAATLLGSLFVERPWCKYLCPYGAVLGWFNRIRIFPVRRRQETCIHCGFCDSACPMNIEVSKAGAVRSSQCISCYECTSERHCPIPDTVVIASGNGGNHHEN